jgi:hypothetical protein
MTSADNVSQETPNGPVVACFLAAGIGAFALGAVVLGGEMGLFVAPTLYGPAGGVSGRTTVAVVIWVVAWSVLHSRWRRRQIQPRKIHIATIALTSVGILGTFPPVWGLF